MDDLDIKHDYMGYHLKIWADRYAFVAEFKGSSRMIRPKKLVVTSNVHPKDIWKDDATLLPILRRFKIVRFATLTMPRPTQVDEEEVRAAYTSQLDNWDGTDPEMGDSIINMLSP